MFLLRSKANNNVPRKSMVVKVTIKVATKVVMVATKVVMEATKEQEKPNQDKITDSALIIWSETLNMAVLHMPELVTALIAS